MFHIGYHSLVSIIKATFLLVQICSITFILHQFFRGSSQCLDMRGTMLTGWFFCAVLFQYSLASLPTSCCLQPLLCCFSQGSCGDGAAVCSSCWRVFRLISSCLHFPAVSSSLLLSVFFYSDSSVRLSSLLSVTTPS